MKKIKKQIENNSKTHSAQRLFLQAVQLHQQGKMEEALSLYQKVLRLNERHFEALANQALIYKKKGQLREAIASYEKAFGLKADPELLSTIGLLYRQDENMEAAVACWEKALTLDSRNAEALLQIGRVLLEKQEFSKAEEYLLLARQAVPNNMAPHQWLGACWRRMPGHFEDAVASFRKAVELAPADSYARGALSEALLINGNLSEGFSQYEWRFKRNELQTHYGLFANKPVWKGEVFSGKKLLAYWEQGFGDTLQFVRYLPQVKERGGYVGLFAQPELARLLGDLPGVDYLSDQSQIKEYDLVVSLMSLPHVFGTSLKSIPATIPYLTVNEQVIEAWKRERAKGKIHVGLVWQGNTYGGAIGNRSAQLSDLAPLANLSGVVYYSLQKNGNIEKLKAEENPFGEQLRDWSGGFRDFYDTAGAIKALDLIISIDTAVPHLAGAMGCPVWLALPYYNEWRWLLQGETTPWYPSMKLFRQSREGDWQEVFRRMAEALKSMALRRRRTGKKETAE